MKRILITGASSGLGLASSKRLAQKGHHIIMLVRSPQKGEAALRSVRKHGSAELLLCDLSDLNQLQAGTFPTPKEPIDVLMHNAGIIETHRHITPQGFERTIAVNHLAMVLLTHTLWASLRDDARIVIVSSGAHKAVRFNLDDWMAEKKYSLIQQYGLSKLCNILFCVGLAKRIKGTKKTVNSVHPGAVNTGLGNNNQTWYAPIGHLVKRFLMKPNKGADTQVWLSIAPELHSQSGGYYYKRKLAPVSKDAKSSHNADVL
ncbi:MAG: SDR family NAD(P)-dependent oxidoreductase, partial [Myxococcota bacterium]|nr:SDR family NAD(P)-dependent oxidoreductase [Myxococcota bacterium]